MNKNNNIVKLACKKFNLIQKELAKELNIPIPTIARWREAIFQHKVKNLLSYTLKIEN
jgi:transcriptional regulator with XRE-family HTH domain